MPATKASVPHKVGAFPKDNQQADFDFMIGETKSTFTTA